MKTFCSEKAAFLLSALVIMHVSVYAQSIEFTYVPASGSSESLRGFVHNVNVSEYGVAVYINVFGTWWTKPSWSAPITPINRDGTFVTRIVTGGQDACAQQVAAYVIPLNYRVPLGTGQSSIPQEIAAHSIAKLVTSKTQGATPIIFSDLTWIPKDTSTCVWGPGPNYFTRTNAIVDSQGRLRLRVSYRNGAWRCAEVMLTNSLGYGTYRFYLDNDISNMPPQLIFGFFTWSEDTDYTHREIDIEFSNGNVIGLPDSWQYVVQPYGLAGHRFRFAEPPGMRTSTHSFTWMPGRVWFASYTGHVPDYWTAIIQRSEDLSGWAEVTRHNVISLTNVIITIPTTNSTYQFYRAMLTSVSADFFHAQGLQVGQRADDGFGWGHHRRLRPATHPVGRRLPPCRKLDQSTLL